MRQLQEYTRLKAGADRPGDLAWRLVLDAMVFQAEAEVRWLDHCEASLARYADRCAPADRAPARHAECRPQSAIADGGDDAMSVLELRDVHRTHGSGDTAVHALRGVTLVGRTRRAGRGHGAVRLGQVHAAQPGRRPRRADQGEVVVEGSVLGRLNRKQLAAVRRRRVGLRVPGPEPAAEPHRRRERRAAPGAGRACACAGPGALALAALDEVGPGRPGAPLPGRDVRRPAAAGRDRPGPGRRPPPGARRRADRRAGLADRRVGAQAAAGPGRRRARPGCW